MVFVSFRYPEYVQFLDWYVDTTDSEHCVSPFDAAKALHMKDLWPRIGEFAKTKDAARWRRLGLVLLDFASVTGSTPEPSL